MFASRQQLNGKVPLSETQDAHQSSESVENLPELWYHFAAMSPPDGPHIARAGQVSQHHKSEQTGHRDLDAGAHTDGPLSIACCVWRVALDENTGCGGEKQEET